MHKFLLLNGPPHCGKDTVTSELVQYIQFQHIKFAGPMKRALAALLDIPESAIENYKDIQSVVLQHTGTTTKEHRDTLRQYLIAMSEDFLKPRYGNDFFGRVFWQHAKNSALPLIVASDCGFVEEVERVVSNAGKRNCILVRIHRSGCTFDGDSRSYMPDGLCDTWDINNDGTIYDFTMKVLRLVTREMGFKLLKEPEWIR